MDILVHERNHTWFSIYRKEAFQTSNITHYYHEEPGDEGTVLVFDSAAYLQHDLSVNHELNLLHCQMGMHPHSPITELRRRTGH